VRGKKKQTKQSVKRKNKYFAFLFFFFFFFLSVYQYYQQLLVNEEIRRANAQRSERDRLPEAKPQILQFMWNIWCAIFIVVECIFIIKTLLVDHRGSLTPPSWVLALWFCLAALLMLCMCWAPFRLKLRLLDHSDSDKTLHQKHQ